MAATTVPIITEWRDGELIPIPMKANVMVFQGTFALVDNTGHAIASTTAVAGTQKCLGVWDSSHDNTSGADGDHVALVRRGKQFLFKNLVADPVAQSDLGATVYVADNQTIAKTHNTNARPVAGVFVGFDTQFSDHVWVEI
ncbi:hypothetical protein [Acinetobacter johnsonii]|uniref:hypothetical protein n=1 Tax=Acinetobacter johnsonii TaxID=40214 RepID=UPI0010403DED|nr:hypothetical protein [Acinetobacter johnsonii]QBK70678.1 hypothetical protein E0Z08_14650 [Acinetobacter johnsonii]